MTKRQDIQVSSKLVLTRVCDGGTNTYVNRFWPTSIRDFWIVETTKEVITHFVKGHQSLGRQNNQSEN